MKVSILVVSIVLPMIATVGLYSYAFISTRWSSLDKDLILKNNLTNAQRENIEKDNVQLESQLIRHAFRSRYGLFGYCLDYKWLHLLKIKTSNNDHDEITSSSKPYCTKCDQTLKQCPETGCCMTRCDNIPDCPSYVDEKECDRQFNQTRYYWKEGNCMWQSTSIYHHGIQYSLSPSSKSERDFHYYVKRMRYYVMLLLFSAAPLLTFIALLILFCINCVKRFYSIPFAFVSIFCFASFLSGAGGLGLFLYEWIQDRLHRPDFAYEHDQTEALIVALNPWLVHAERLGLAFWITVAAIGTSLFTTILSFCFCCGLQSGKSKLRIHINNNKYAIVDTGAYEE